MKGEKFGDDFENDLSASANAFDALERDFQEVSSFVYSVD